MVLSVHLIVQVCQITPWTEQDKQLAAGELEDKLVAGTRMKTRIAPLKVSDTQKVSYLSLRPIWSMPRVPVVNLLELNDPLMSQTSRSEMGL